MFKIVSRKLFLVGLFFFGFPIFYYVKDIYFLYVLAKVVVPAFAAAFSIFLLVNRKRWDYFSIFLLFLWFYLTVMSTIQAWINFQQPFLIGLTAQTKLLPIFFYWCFLYLLYKFQPTEREVSRATSFLGWTALLVYYYFNLFVDPSSFNVQQSSVASYMRGLGFLFQFPLEIIYLTVFIYIHRYIHHKRLLTLFLTAPFLIFLAFYGNQRQQLIAFSTVIFFELINVSTKNAFLRLTQILLIASTFFVAIFGIAYISNPEKLYSLSVRSNTALQILDFFERNPISLFFGAGNLSPLNKILMRDIFSKSFYSADVGWLGLLFEFGLVGCILLVTLYIRMLKILKERSVFISAAKDLVVMYILLVLGTAIAYQIGMFTTILAVSVYLMQRHKSETQNEVRSKAQDQTQIESVASV